MTLDQTKLFFLVVLICFVTPFFALAQESVTLSISPTLFDMSAEPGQEWQSNLRIINVNKFDLTVYIEVVNFAPKGEGGDGRFIPIVDEEGEGVTLAEWIKITKEAVVIPREQTKEVPFTVSIPKDASPGGHFAAILVGTKPLKSEAGQARLQTAQMVTSLFFARVAGDVLESGVIREFTTAHTYLNSPEATFSLRFENKGNVHLQPQGEIQIFNMWGQERGLIPINQYTNFGNVLPNSIRKFTFTWKGEWSVADIGRYTAVATLGYGTDEKKFSSAKTNFWVIPYKFLLGIFLGLALFFGLISWLIRLYVRHMLLLAGISIEDYHSVKSKAKKAPLVTKKKPIKFHAPVKTGILDLTERMRASSNARSRVKALLTFILQYRLFFFGMLLLLLFIITLVWYITNANTKHRAYEVLYVNNESTTAITSEEIIYDQLKAEQAAAEESQVDEALPKLAIVNRSGVPGLGAKIRLQLEKQGYKVITLEADFTSIQRRTVVVYPANLNNEALTLSALLNNSLISVVANTDKNAPITVFLGSDIEEN